MRGSGAARSCLLFGTAGPPVTGPSSAEESHQLRLQPGGAAEPRDPAHPRGLEQSPVGERERAPPQRKRGAGREIRGSSCPEPAGLQDRQSQTSCGPATGLCCSRPQGFTHRGAAAGRCKTSCFKTTCVVADCLEHKETGVTVKALMSESCERGGRGESGWREEVVSDIITSKMSPKECSCEPSRVKWFSSCVQRTGCQCPGPDEVLAVLEGMSSADEESGKLLIEELLSLLQRNTKGTLPVILGFLESPQVTTAHRSAVLQAVEKLLHKTSAQHLDESLAKSTVSMALNEMTMSPKWLPDWQQPASNIVVSVVRDHYDSTMDMVLSFFQPGVLPHHTLLNTVGDISRNCSHDIARDIVRLLDLLVPVLSLAETKKMKAMMSFALESLYESWAKFQGPGQCVQDCSSQVITSFDIVHRWLPSSEPKVMEAIVLALAAMCCLLPEEKFQSELPEVLQAFQPLYAAELDISYSRINKSLSVLMEAAVPKARPVLESQLEQLLTMVHAQVCASFKCPGKPEEERSASLVQMFCVLAGEFPGSVLEISMSQLDNLKEQDLLGSLTILAKLVGEDCVKECVSDFLASPDIFMLGASQPHRGGRECLSLLQSLGPVIHPQLPSVWEPLIPPLARLSQLGASQPHRGGSECLSLLQSLGPVIHRQLPSVWEPLILPLARLTQNFQRDSFP
ncbi:MROH1 protein, partial [Atractosteus spatula]|nr:MROH1 protein [Atractosteus spatula]